MGYNGPINPNPGNGEALIVIYGYVPSRALGAIGAATFGLVFVAHLACFARLRGTRLFQGLMALGGLMEVVGYCFRLKSTDNPFLVVPFIVQYFLIVCAPIFFAAAMYLCLSVAIRRTPGGKRFLPMTPRQFVTGFVTMDVVCTVTQVVGAAFIGVSESRKSQGETPPVTTKQANDILLSGLAAQSASLLVYLTILVRVISKCLHHSNDHLEPHERLSLKFLSILMFTSLLITLRTMFRLAETAQGVFGFASSHESLFGALEYVPIVIATGCWAVWPLGVLVPPPPIERSDDEKNLAEMQTTSASL